MIRWRRIQPGLYRSEYGEIQRDAGDWLAVPVDAINPRWGFPFYRVATLRGARGLIAQLVDRQRAIETIRADDADVANLEYLAELERSDS